MGFDLDLTIPTITVFLQGILSFFSPCVLPIIPLYMGYLSGGTHEVDQDGNLHFNQKRVIVNTLFFIIGVSFAFFLLGFSVTMLGQFFTDNQLLFSRIGGILIILLGLMQLGVFNQPFKGREFKLPIKINALQMNPITALVMGFTFSFAWTPCVGPALSTVLIMVSSSNSTTIGLALIGVYTFGFTLPFMLVGVFTTKCLSLLKSHMNVVKYTVKIGAVIMILMGIMMYTGTMNSVTSYLSAVTDSSDTTAQENTDIDTEEALPEENSEDNSNSQDTVLAPTFELVDQYGEVHTLEDYQGKVIFLNFWATWCSPCTSELPYIQQIYEDYGYNEEDVIVLGVAFPTDENQYTSEGTSGEVADYLLENGYTYPTLMDTSASLMSSYSISAFPTTFMIDTSGNVQGYVTGSLTYDIMVSIIEQTLESEQ
ncbi:MAG: cytochrome c biogenesis protein/redoxin [Clostridia bacterium]